MRIDVHLPDHQNALEWLNEKKITWSKLDHIVQGIAIHAEGKMKELVTQATSAPSSGRYPKLPSTGVTRASIMSWFVGQTETSVAYAVGTLTRGAQLMWLDRGRGWVFPKGARALFIKKGKAVDQFGRPIFHKFARPSRAFNILFNTASYVFSQMEEIIKPNLE